MVTKNDVKKKTQVKKPTYKDRIKSPAFLLAASALLYKLYTWLAANYGFPVIGAEDWRMTVDLIAYLLIGVGINSSFTEKK